MINYLWARIKEPSSWAGFGVLTYVADHIQSVAQAAASPAQLVMGVAALVAVALSEKGGKA